MPPAQTDVLIRPDKSRGIHAAAFLYNRMLKNRHFVVNQGSLHLIWSRFFTALRKLQGFPDRKRFLPQNMLSCFCVFLYPWVCPAFAGSLTKRPFRRYAFYRRSENPVWRDFFHIYQLQKKGEFIFMKKLSYYLKQHIPGYLFAILFNGYRGQPGSALPAGDPTYRR